MNDDFDYEKDLEIDPDALDVAALEQSNLAMRYSQAAAHHDRLAKKAHERVKVLRSQLTKEVATDPEGCLGKGQKATGAMIEAYYRDHPDYIAAKEAMIDAEYQRDLVKAAADHVSYQRKRMIEVLAQLLQQEYFSSPAAPRELAREWQNHKKERIEKTAGRIQPQRKRS